MALTEKDITVIGVNTTEYIHLTAYVMFCYKTFEDYAILHLDPVTTPIDELRRGIVEKSTSWSLSLQHSKRTPKMIELMCPSILTTQSF